jgi:hypothetical protein
MCEHSVPTSDAHKLIAVVDVLPKTNNFHITHLGQDGVIELTVLHYLITRRPDHARNICSIFL